MARRDVRFQRFQRCIALLMGQFRISVCLTRKLVHVPMRRDKPLFKLRDASLIVRLVDSATVRNLQDHVRRGLPLNANGYDPRFVLLASLNLSPKGISEILDGRTRGGFDRFLYRSAIGPEKRARDRGDNKEYCQHWLSGHAGSNAPD